MPPPPLLISLQHIHTHTPHIFYICSIVVIRNIAAIRPRRDNNNKLHTYICNVLNIYTGRESRIAFYQALLSVLVRCPAFACFSVNALEGIYSVYNSPFCAGQRTRIKAIFRERACAAQSANKCYIHYSQY